MSQRRDHHLAAYGAMTVVVLAFSIGSTVVKETGAPGPVVAFWRMLFTAICWQVIAFKQGYRPTRQAVRDIGPLGVLFGINLIMFFTAATKTAVATLEMISAFSPMLMFPAAAYLFHERLRWKNMGWALGAIGGIAVVVSGGRHGGHSTAFGNVLAFGALFTWVTYLLLSKSARSKYSVSQIMSNVTLAGAITLAPYALSRDDITDVSGKGWVLIGVLTVITGVTAHGLIVWCQRRLALSTITMLQVAQPALAVLWAFVILGETVRPIQGVGIAIVIGCLAGFTLVSSRTVGAVAPTLTADC